MPTYLNYLNSQCVTFCIAFKGICKRIYAHSFLFNIYIFFEVYLLSLHACHSWGIFKSYLMSTIFTFCWSSITVVQIQKTGSFTCFYHGTKTVWDGVKKMATINIAIIKTDWRKIVLRKIVIHHYFTFYWQVILYHLALSAGCAYTLSVWI